MLRWSGKEGEHGKLHVSLFADELFGIDDALARVAGYFKAAAAGSEVGRRLLLLLGPPSGGKSTLVIRSSAGWRNTATPMPARCTASPAVRCASRRCIWCRTPAPQLPRELRRRCGRRVVPVLPGAAGA
jgi:hypothetical protein